MDKRGGLGRGTVQTLETEKVKENFFFFLSEIETDRQMWVQGRGRGNLRQTPLSMESDEGLNPSTLRS